MDVAAQHEDRRRRATALALPRRNLGQQADQVVEAVPERRPVLQVHGQAHPLPEPRADRLVRPIPRHHLVPALQVVQRGQHERGQRRADHQMVHVRVQAGAACPLPFIVVHHAAVLRVEVPGGAHVEHHHAHAPEIALEAPLGGAALGVGPHREIGQDPLALSIRPGRPQRLVHLVAVQLVGREIAQVLVHEIAGERPDHPVLPPRLRGHLAPPRVRRVPVVPQVVVVEDHAARHGRQQPPHVRITPRLVVQPGVLLEVADLVRDVPIATRARRVPHRLGPASRAPALGQLVRDLLAGDVRVHLVAEQQHRVGPVVVRGPGHLVRQRHQGVRPDLAQRARRLVLTPTARAERQPHRVVGARRADHAGPLGVQRPGGLAVQRDLILGFGAFGQVTQVQHREMVPEHAPARLAQLLLAGANRHPARGGHLDPHRRFGRVDVPQQGADEYLRAVSHATSVPPRT